MACKYCNNCCCCEHFVKTTNICEDGHFLTLEIPDKTYKDGELICICLAQEVPKQTKPLRMNIGIGGNRYAIINTCTVGRYGTPNYLYSDQLLRKCDGQVRSRQIINVRFAPDTFLFNYVGNRKPLCKTNACIPEVDFVKIKEKKEQEEEIA